MYGVAFLIFCYVIYRYIYPTIIQQLNKKKTNIINTIDELNNMQKKLTHQISSIQSNEYSSKDLHLILSKMEEKHKKKLANLINQKKNKNQEKTKQTLNFFYKREEKTIVKTIIQELCQNFEQINSHESFNWGLNYLEKTTLKK